MIKKLQSIPIQGDVWLEEEPVGEGVPLHLLISFFLLERTLGDKGRIASSPKVRGLSG